MSAEMRTSSQTGHVNSHTRNFTVTSDYTARDSRFTGKINWVQLDLGKDDHDHFIDPEERLRIAMARQ